MNLMTLGEVVIAAFLALASTGLGTLLWSRLNRIEDRLERVEEALAGKAEASALESLRDELATKADKADLESLREELATKADKADVAGIRGELANLRSDLTQIALAVGARQPRASEG
jgi:uncharacterized protein YicC (UPF0701 family)